MGVEIAVVAVLFLLILLLVSRVPIAFTLIACGAVGITLLDGQRVATATLARTPLQATANYTLIVIPMFIAMSVFAKHAGLAERGFDLLSRRLGAIPGGLAIATVFACALFGAVSGSSVATVAAVGKVSVREMLRHGYDKGLATGVVGAAATLGVLIPPSIVLVLYGTITGEPIGTLLIAGIIPGILSAILYVGMIMVRVRFQPALAGRHEGRPEPRNAVRTRPNRVGTADGTNVKVPAIDKGRSGDLGVLGRVGVLFGIVVGGIYLGLATATEAAALGAFAAVLVFVMDHRRGIESIRRRFESAIEETVNLVAMIFALVVGAILFSTFIVRARIPQSFADWAVGLGLAPLLTVALLLLLLLPLGMVLDGLSMLLITMPVLHPVAISLGFDGVWFGILAVKMIELGLITPPIGINVYVVASTADEVAVEDAFRGLAPFYIVDVLTIGALFMFPGLVMWLPSLMRG